MSSTQSDRVVTPTPRSRLEWVDTGRGLAILLVALYHSTNWMMQAGVHLQVWNDVNVVLSSLRMPLFFTVSGLFARKWIDGRWRDLFRSKLCLFWWTFLIWEGIGTLTIMLGQRATGIAINPLGEAKALVLSPLFPRFELWFIWALALLFVIAKATRRVDARIQLAVAGVIAAFALWWWVDRTTGPIGVAKYYFFFIAGIHGKSLILRFGATRNPLLAGGSLALWAAVSVTFFVFGIRDIFGMYFLNCLVGLAGGITISRALRRLKVLGTVGRQTLPIYLAHTPVIISLSFIVVTTHLIPALNHAPWAVTPVTAGIAVTVAYLLYRFCLRHWTRYLYEPPLAAFDAWVARRSTRSARPR